MRDWSVTGVQTCALPISIRWYLDSKLLGGKKMTIGVGQTAPDFALQNQDKKNVKLSDFASNKNVVLVWYPLCWIPTCTHQHAFFVNDMRSFDQLDSEGLAVIAES